MSVPLLLLVTRPTAMACDTTHGTPGDPGFVRADARLPHVNVLDQGVTRGDGIFETVGVAGTTPHALELHLDRFEHSARLLDLPVPDRIVWRDAVLAAVAQHVAEHGPSPELLVKMVLTRGIEGSTVPTGWVLADTVGDVSAARTRGIRVVTLDRGYRHDVAQTSPWLLQGAKTLSYAINKAAVREAERRGADDVIFVSSDGFVLEGPTSNVILREGNTIRTPGTDLGILAGTTQANVFEFFADRGYDTEYALIPVAELQQADAAWLVSSVRRAAPIRVLDGREQAVDDELTAQLNEHLRTRDG